MTRSETILWQSKLFPKLVLTAEHLNVLKSAYQLIKHFEPEMRKAEAWLFANQHRLPKKNWKSFINNWMRIADEKIRDKQRTSESHARYGDATQRTPHDPKLLSDILSVGADGYPPSHPAKGSHS